MYATILRVQRFFFVFSIIMVMRGYCTLLYCEYRGFFFGFFVFNHNGDEGILYATILRVQRGFLFFCFFVTLVVWF